MRSAVFLRDIIGKAQHIFLIGFIPLQSDFNTNAIICIHSEMENFIQMGFTLVDIFDKFRQTTLKIKYML